MPLNNYNMYYDIAQNYKITTVQFPIRNTIGTFCSTNFKQKTLV